MFVRFRQIVEHRVVISLVFGATVVGSELFVANSAFAQVLPATVEADIAAPRDVFGLTDQDWKTKPQGFLVCAPQRHRPSPLNELVAQNDPKAMVIKALARDYGEYGACLNQGAKRDSTIIELLRRAADLGNPRANYELGELYQTGHLVEANPALALQLFVKAAEGGSIIAMRRLGKAYNVDNIVQASPEVAEFWLNRAVSLRDPVSLNFLGRRYAFGETVQRDGARAVSYYLSAIDAGSTESYAELGRLYRQGIAIPKNTLLAVEFYKRGVAAGDSSSREQLGLMYRDGDGVPRDLVKALELFEADRFSWSTNSVFYYAQMLALGQGTEKNEPEALVQFREAASRGIEGADAAANALRASLLRQNEIAKQARIDAANAAIQQREARRQEEANRLVRQDELDRRTTVAQPRTIDIQSAYMREWFGRRERSNAVLAGLSRVDIDYPNGRVTNTEFFGSAVHTYRVTELSCTRSAPNRFSCRYLLKTTTQLGGGVQAVFGSAPMERESRDSEYFEFSRGVWRSSTIAQKAFARDQEWEASYAASQAEMTRNTEAGIKSSFCAAVPMKPYDC